MKALTLPNINVRNGDSALRMIELLKDKTVMKAFKEDMFPQTISNKLDLLAQKITQMSARMEDKEKTGRMTRNES